MYVIFPCGITWHLIITFMNPILHEMHCQYYAAKCACVSTRHMMNLSYNNYKDWMHVILPCFMKCQKVIPNMNHFLYRRNAILIIIVPINRELKVVQDKVLFPKILVKSKRPNVQNPTS